MLRCERAGDTSFHTVSHLYVRPLQAGRYLGNLPGMGFGNSMGKRGMLYTLVMMVCLTDVPQTCARREQIVDGLAMNPGTAFMQAQPLVARWIDTHPGYFVRRWRLLPSRGT